MEQKNKLTSSEGAKNGCPLVAFLRGPRIFCDVSMHVPVRTHMHNLLSSVESVLAVELLGFADLCQMGSSSCE